MEEGQEREVTHMHRRPRSLAFMLAGVLTIMTACSSATSPAPPTAASGSTATAGAVSSVQPQASAATGQANGIPSDTLVVAASVLPINFDGEKAVNIGNIEILETIGDHLLTSKRVQNKDGLWEYDFSQPIPQLADTWDIADGGQTYTFHLHPGVKSPYGNEFTANDVKWRWQRMWVLRIGRLEVTGRCGSHRRAYRPISSAASQRNVLDAAPEHVHVLH
jgi:ABC-type transport system substrate-binding protein